MLDYPVPPPGPPGPFGTMAWLRASVSRFAEGETHARRRTLIEARLASLDPAALRAAARAAAGVQSGGVARASSGVAAANSDTGAANSDTGAAASSDTGAAASSDTGAAASSDTGAAASSDTGAAASSDTGAAASSDTGAAASSDTGAANNDTGAANRDTGAAASSDTGAANNDTGAANRDTGAAASSDTGAANSDTGAASSGVALEYVPVAVLAAATGIEGDVVDDVRTIAAAYQPGTDAPGADEALRRVLQRLPGHGEEEMAQHVALLVQACEATAALIRGDDPPVPSTKRLDPDGNVITIDLAGRSFGEGRRACPAREHALALAAGVNDVR